MNKFKKMVIATRNPSKVSHYRSILEAVADEVVGLGTLGIEGKPSEDGTTAEENAKIKARFYSAKCNLPVFSEDEALYVDFLPQSEQPATHIRRINGKDEVDDDKLLNYWEEKVSKVPVEKRTGRWHIAYCIATPEGKVKVVALDHPVLFFSPSSKIRLPGWPMSSLEGSPLFGKPHSEQTPEEKEISKQRTADELIKCLGDLV